MLRDGEHPTLGGAEQAERCIAGMFARFAAIATRVTVAGGSGGVRRQRLCVQVRTLCHLLERAGGRLGRDCHGLARTNAPH